MSSVSTNAWANIRLGSSGHPDFIHKGVGITGPKWTSSSVHGISFSNPMDFLGGGYVVLYTPEIKNYATQIFRAQIFRGDTSVGATQAGTTEGTKYRTYKSTSLISTSWTTPADYVTTDDVCINLAAFSFKRNADIYIPAIRNLIHSTMTSWTNSSAFTLVEDKDPIGNDVYKLSLYNSTTTSNPVILTPTTSASNKTYTSSFYAKAGDTGSMRVILGTLSETVSRYDFRLNLYGATGMAVGNTISGNSIASVTTNTGTNNSVSVSDYGAGWKKVIVTHRPASGSNGSVRLYLDFNTGGPVNSNYIFMSSPQIEEGSEATPFIPSGSNAPVVGNQDYRRSFVPGASGFGITGATYSSVSLNTNSSRSATAYGTIVIPPIGSTGSPVIAYIENSMNVSGVSAGGSGNTGEYDVLFSKPMNDANYCVLLSPENEATIVASPDYASMEEFSMLVVNRNWKTIDGFRAASLKQRYISSSDNKFAPSRIQATRGLTERIHFVVFGGATYGQP